MQPGEILGLVGQSGSGKSTLSLSILRLLHLKGGTARGNLVFKGEDLSAKSESQMRSLRGREISIVLQSPLTSLNPALRIGSHLSEAWRAHATGMSEECATAIRAALPHLRRHSASLPVQPRPRPPSPPLFDVPGLYPCARPRPNPGVIPFGVRRSAPAFLSCSRNAWVGVRPQSQVTGCTLWPATIASRQPVLYTLKMLLFHQENANLCLCCMCCTPVSSGAGRLTF